MYILPPLCKCTHVKRKKMVARNFWPSLVQIRKNKVPQIWLKFSQYSKAFQLKPLSAGCLSVPFSPERYKGATIFFGMGGHEFPKVPRQYFCDPLFDDQKFYDPPSGTTMLKKHVTPNARSTENMHFGGYFFEQIFIKICSHPIISWFFFVTPPISH